MPNTVIEYPAQGSSYSYDEYGVYEYGVYPVGSVLEGQERRSFLGSYPTLKEAQSEHPEAVWDDEAGFVEPAPIPASPPAWFDPGLAGESWDGE